METGEPEREGGHAHSDHLNGGECWEVQRQPLGFVFRNIFTVDGEEDIIQLGSVIPSSPPVFTTFNLGRRRRADRHHLNCNTKGGSAKSGGEGGE